MSDTIVALSSGPPPAAIAVVRISGPAAFDAARAIAGKLPAPREARVRKLRNETGLLDQALVLAFPAPDTATGEDLVEFHLHGGIAVVDAVLATLARYDGVRLAEAGEFTRRALLNGRLDLTQVEGLAALLAAQTEAQRRVAVRAADGAVQRHVAGIETQLLAVSAKVELLLDFADEADGGNEAAIRLAIDTSLHTLRRELTLWLAAPSVDGLLRGFRVVFAGEANSGKSTLLNRMAGREAAIVSDRAGTTRDRIDVPVQHGGIAFVLTDTAGLNAAADDPVEIAGIGRARQAIEEADVLLWLGDGQAPRGDAIMIHARADRPERRAVPTGRIRVSAHEGAGLASLWTAIHSAIRSRVPSESEVALNDRQRRELAKASDSIAQAMGAGDLILCGHHLASARRAIDRVTGRSDTEAMLDSLFRGFCIGK
jgi:tRNA modification GTPase